MKIFVSFSDRPGRSAIPAGRFVLRRNLFENIFGNRKIITDLAQVSTTQYSGTPNLP